MSKSIFLLLIFLLIIAVFFYLLKKFIQPNVNRVNKWRRNLQLAGGYLALLILLIPITAFMDTGELFFSSNPEKELLALAPTDWYAGGRLYHLPEDMRFEEQEGLYKSSSQTFAAEGQLEIRMIGQKGYEKIFLERKESADGVVEVSTYVAPHYARSDWSLPIDVTKLVPPPQISMAKGILKIESPVKKELTFRNFSGNFAISQFKSKSQSMEARSVAIQGEKGILIRVPSDLEIVSDDNVRIQWVK